MQWRIKNNELAHSKGPWKDHKYLRKYKKDGKWHYVYSGDAAPAEAESESSEEKNTDNIEKANAIKDTVKEKGKRVIDKTRWTKNKIKAKYHSKELKANSEKLAAKTRWENNKKTAKKQKTSLKIRTKVGKLKSGYQNFVLNLKHSGLPAGVELRMPYPNELVHSKGPWKEHAYIKKYKNKNGKWVYVYKDERSTGEKILDAVIPTPIKTIINSVKGIKESQKRIAEQSKASKNKNTTYKTKSKGTHVATIQHSAKGTTWEKKEHKYVSKEVRNGKTYYKYNSKTKTFQQATPEEMDTRPHNEQEQLRLATESTVVGLKQAQENMLTRRGLIDGSTLLNKSVIAENKINSKVNGGQARRRSNK